MFGGSIWGSAGVVPPNSVKIFASLISTDIKNTGTVNLVAQEIDFWGTTLGGSRSGGMIPLNDVEIFVC